MTRLIVRKQLKENHRDNPQERTDDKDTVKRAGGPLGENRFQKTAQRRACEHAETGNAVEVGKGTEAVLLADGIQRITEGGHLHPAPGNTASICEITKIQKFRLATQISGNPMTMTQNSRMSIT